MATKFLDSAGLTELLAKINTWGTGKFAVTGDLDKLIKSIAYDQSTRIVTITYNDGTTDKTLTLPTASTGTAGLTKLYSSTGSNSDGAYTQAALTKTTAGSSGATLINTEAITNGSVSIAAGSLKVALNTLAGSISTNAASIKTNTTNIATNTSDIASLKETVDTLSGGGGTLADYVKTATLASSTSGESGASLVGVEEITSSDSDVILAEGSLVETLTRIADYIADNASNIGKKADKTTTVNGHALSSNVTVAPADLAYSNSLTSGGSSLTMSDVKAALDALVAQVNTNTAACEAGLQMTVVDTLPTASADTTGKLYLVANSNGDTDAYNEYVTVAKAKGDGTATQVYSWEKLGSTGNLKLSDYWAQADLVALTTTEVDALCNTNLK